VIVAFVPLPRAVGETQRLKGDFSKALYYRMQSSAEVERRIGYRVGRLRDGWWLMFLTVMPNVDDFQYRGYSQMSGGRIQGHLPQNQYAPTAEQRLQRGGFNLTGTNYQAEGLKQKTIREVFRVSGPDRLAKVRPVAREHGDRDIPDYPPGSGIPQWTLTRELVWVAAAFIAPGQMYKGNYT
jgi:hypothetical protein